MLLLISLVLLLGVTACHSSCPSNGATHDRICYWISSTRDTWDNAMARCVDDGGYLAEIKSAEVNNFLDHLATIHSVSDFWIGGKDDIRGTGGWMWMGSKTHMNVFSGYRAWGQSYPRNMFTRMFLGTRCAIVKNREWEDTKCDEHHAFACQV